MRLEMDPVQLFENEIRKNQDEIEDVIRQLMNYEERISRYWIGKEEKLVENEIEHRIDQMRKIVRELEELAYDMRKHCVTKER